MAILAIKAGSMTPRFAWEAQNAFWRSIWVWLSFFVRKFYSSVQERDSPGVAVAVRRSWTRNMRIWRIWRPGKYYLVISRRKSEISLLSTAALSATLGCAMIRVWTRKSFSISIFADMETKSSPFLLEKKFCYAGSGEAFRKEECYTHFGDNFCIKDEVEGS